jgi:hypothetical protein
MMSVAALAALVVGWMQPMPAAEAGFDSAATASAAVATHTLATPVLTCDPGGLLVTTVTLRWAAVSSATTADPYSSPPNSTYLADGYEIERSTNGGAFTVLGTAARTASSYVDSPGGLLTTYKYQIRTKSQNWRSPASNQATVSVTSILFVGLNTSCTA